MSALTFLFKKKALFTKFIIYHSYTVRREPVIDFIRKGNEAIDRDGQFIVEFNSSKPTQPLNALPHSDHPMTDVVHVKKKN